MCHIVNKAIGRPTTHMVYTCFPSRPWVKPVVTMSRSLKYSISSCVAEWCIYAGKNMPTDHYLNNIVLFYHDSPITRSHFMDPTDRAIKGFYCITIRDFLDPNIDVIKGPYFITNLQMTSCHCVFEWTYLGSRALTWYYLHQRPTCWHGPPPCEKKHGAASRSS